MNYRILYFFHGRVAAVLAHGLVKKNEVPMRDIELMAQELATAEVSALWCLWQLGEVPQMLDHLMQAETLATTLGDQTRLGAVFSRMSLYLFLISQHDRALEAGERALAIAKSLGDTHLEVGNSSRKLHRSSKLPWQLRLSGLE